MIKVINKFLHAINNKKPIQNNIITYELLNCSICGVFLTEKRRSHIIGSDEQYCDNCLELVNIVNNYSIKTKDINDKRMQLEREKITCIERLVNFKLFDSFYPNHKVVINPNIYMNKLLELDKDIDKIVQEYKDLTNKYNNANFKIQQLKEVNKK